MDLIFVLIVFEVSRKLFILYFFDSGKYFPESFMNTVEFFEVFFKK